MKLKFCGIRRFEDIELMNEFKPDYIGFVFAESKRQITADQAKKLTDKLDKNIKTVGVFVDEQIENVIKTTNTAGLTIIQLHGNENEDYIKSLKAFLPKVEVWKAIRVLTTDDILKAKKSSADMLLLDSFSADAHGGTGKVANLSVIKSASLKRSFFLAGGLKPENINTIIKEIKPYGVDLSSGIEVDGYKNKNKILEIMRCLDCLR